MTRHRLALVQGAYYLATGLWPLASMSTFEAVTGPKGDDWLVRTVGLLAIASGGVLTAAGLDDGGRTDRRDVGIATAIAFAAASLWYGGTGRVRRIYLADGLVELAFLALWAASRPQRDTRPVRVR